MEKFYHLFFSITALALLLFSQKATVVYGGMDTRGINHVKGIIGAIVDYSSRIGKEEKVAMEMAIDDFYNHTNQRLILRLRNSQGEPIKAARAATNLIKKQEVQAILGPRSWEEASLVAQIGTQYHIPVLAFLDSAPLWATKRWPFLIQASPGQRAQTKAVAAVVQPWGWRRVILIYEDTDSSSNGVIPHLSEALRDVGVEISHLVALSPFASSSSLSEQLKKLKREQYCRVFVVHSSLPLALRLFETAKMMKMMEKDYVWITTDSTTSLVHSIKASTISSMQGILGVKSYFPEKGSHFQDFYTRFRKKFGVKHPEEEKHDPGIFALQAYDATWAVALSMEECNNKEGQHLLDNILSSDFNGLSGKVQFTEGKLSPAHVFQIVNVIGKSYRELGFWSDGLGFSETIDEGAIYNNSSMENLGQVFWPGGPSSTPRGWSPPWVSSHLRIGVPNDSLASRFVSVVYDHSTNNYSVTGFSIDVFKETVKLLPYYLPFDFIPFNGTYDALVEQVHLKNFDAVVGAAMIASRCKYAEFAHPHTESGLVMVVPVQSQSSNKAWLFMKPFTKAMWILTASINVYNGFVIWMIERNHCSELRGSALNQLGTLLWLAFATLFSLHGERLHSNLSRMATLVWLFVALVITQSYTANLTSMLTVQRLEPTVADIATLKNSNAMIGYSNKSFVVNYLVDVLGFNYNNIKDLTSTEGCAQALKSGEIAAAYLEVPVAKLFLAKYRKSFITAGPTYKVGGSAFALPKGSPMLADINEALLKLSENGKLLELENSLTASEKCVDGDLDYEHVSLSPNSFWVLFIISGATSTAALAIYAVRGNWRPDNSMPEPESTWILILVVMQHWEHLKRRFSTSDSDAERLRNPPDLWIQL